VSARSSHPSRKRVTSSSQTLSLVEEEVPLLNTYISWSWIPTGLETKNHRAGEDQQQFNLPTESLKGMLIGFIHLRSAYKSEKG
jgi:hypothetical protein